MSHRTLRGPVADAIEEWLGLHDRFVPGVVEGLYLVGSVALDDWTPHSDVDIVAFVADPTDVEVVASLEAAHESYRSGGGRSGVERPTVDGPFLSWADVGGPPVAAQRAWSLDGEFRFDGECFEINPVTWYTLAEHGIAVRGPASAALEVHLDEFERRRWVTENVDTYWRVVRDEIAEILVGDSDRTEFAASSVEWCALGVARMWFTVDTGGVVSKNRAGRWAARRLPQHADVFDVAARVRSGDIGEQVGRAEIESLVDAMGTMIDAIV